MKTQNYVIILPSQVAYVYHTIALGAQLPSSAILHLLSFLVYDPMILVWQLNTRVNHQRYFIFVQVLITNYVCGMWEQVKY